MTDPLATWLGLNNVAPTLTEEECLALLEREKAGKRRVQFMLRLHSRLNRVRADRERLQIQKLARGAH